MLLLGCEEVRREAGEGVPGRTDGDPGEDHLGDGQRLRGGGDWTGRPVVEGLLDQQPGHSEACHDDTQPEQSGQAPLAGDVREPVDS